MSPSYLDDFNKVLRVGIERGASDVHVKVALPPIFRIDGRLVPLKDAPRYSAEDVTHLAHEIMGDERYRERFREHNDIDLAYGVGGLGRFRVNIFQQRGTLGMVFRLIPPAVKSFDELNLPPVLEKIAAENRGLILVTGTTGTGKSTSLAAMIDDINKRIKGHILTVEDPIEFVHSRRNCLISQREIGVHSPSFAAALHSALREDPDVILVGELRDLETMSMAVTAAEMGILVMGTLHTNGAAPTVDRLVNAFPADKQPHVRTMLSTSLRGVVSQQLIPKTDKQGRVAALEILINTPAVANLIRQGKMDQLENAMQSGAGVGMRLMDSAIQTLLDQRQITGKEAFKKAINKTRFEQYREAS